MEIWDLYNKNREALNRTHCRDEEMLSEEYHVVVEIWTVNSNKEILLTLRHPDKKGYPNFWENTGGSVLTGETSREGAVRELKEETGIEANEEELIFLGTQKAENIFFDTYMIRKNVGINALKLQEGETVDIQWVNIEKFNRMADLGEIVPPLMERLQIYRERFEEFLFY